MPKHSNGKDMTEEVRHFESAKPKRSKMADNLARTVNEYTSDGEHVISDSEVSDLSGEDCASEEDFSSESSSSDNECTSDGSDSVSTTEKSWRVVLPPEPAIDMKSKFTVNKVGYCNLPKGKHPVDFLSLFLTEELFAMMVEKTNAYARYMLEHVPDVEGMNHWHDVTLVEMRKFWSILINMGLSQMRSYKDYWSPHPVLSMPFFARVMPLDRFKSMLSMFNLTSIDNLPKSDSKQDQLVEVERLLAIFNSAFKRFYVPQQEIRLDEGLIYSSKENQCIIKYRPKKYLAQDGIQKLEICDSSSEYIIHVSLKKYRSGNKGHVVFDLINEAQLAGKGYHLFIGKTYTDIKLAEKLLSINTFLTGPVDKSKYGTFPTFITTSYVKPGTTLYARSGYHLLIKYNVQKPVCLSTGGWAEDQSIENAKSQQRVRPLIIRRYLRYMGGKDKSSLHITSTITIDSFWKKIAFNLVDMAIHNAYLLFKSQKKNPQKWTKQKFLEDIVEELSNFTTQNYGPPSLRFGHMLSKTLGRVRHSCVVCRKQDEETFYCAGCDVSAHEQCFKAIKHGLDKNKVQRKRRVPKQLPAGATGSSISALNGDDIEFVEIKVEDDE